MATFTTRDYFNLRPVGQLELDLRPFFRLSVTFDTVGEFVTPRQVQPSAGRTASA